MQRINVPIAILVTFPFFGCGTPGTPATDGGIADSTTVRVSTPPAQLINDLVGTWMPEDYRDCLTRQRSAFACRTMADDIYVMYVEQAGADSLRWSYITTHEGGPELMLAYDQQGQGFVGRPGEYSAEEMVHVRSVDPDHRSCALPDKAPCVASFVLKTNRNSYSAPCSPGCSWNK